MAGPSLNSSSLELLRSLSPDQREQVIRSMPPDMLASLALEVERLPKWQPLPGPQTAALASEADFLFFGGAAGGGKSDLLLGLAHTQHRRAIIFRREYAQLRALVDRSVEMYGDRGTFNRADLVWSLMDGRQVEFGAVQHVGDEQRFQGRPHDLIGVDEAPHLHEAQFRFLCGWLRTTESGQRCRVVLTGNPPTDEDGNWIVRFFAPWLDPLHPNPAQPGELRYFTTGPDGKDMELPNGDPVLVGGEVVRPRSRTFIPAKVQDNPYLMASDYVANLQALPEPLRSKMLRGDFSGGGDEDPWRVIPIAWIRAAQARWKEREGKPATDAGGKPVPMDALGVDVARGGKDKTIITPRWGNLVGRAWCYPGSSTPDGPTVAALVIGHREGKAVARVDVIGVGTAVVDALRAGIGDATIPMNGAAASNARDKSGELGFFNLRAEWYWGLREALDPATGDDLALPPDPELAADLASPRWKMTTRGIQIESKDDIIKRIGRSPDKGDSCVYACAVHQIAGAGWLEFARSELQRVTAEKNHGGAQPQARA